MTDAWLESQIAEIRREAREAHAECARCRGREYGDCSDGCQFWWATATEAERERAGRAGTGHKSRTKHRWEGPCAPEKSTYPLPMEG